MDNILDSLVYVFFCFLLTVWTIFSARQNLIIIFLAIELMFLCLNFSFIRIGCYLNDILGFIMFFILLSLAGAEASLALSILIIVYRLRGLISMYILSFLKS